MKFRLKDTTLAALVAGVCFAAPAAAAVTVVPGPVGTSEIGAKMRWGGSGYEAAIRDNGTDFAQLFPAGTPVWAINSPHNFEVFFNSSTGTLSLSVDFNQDNSFGVGETTSRSSFTAGADGLTDYTGKAFNYVSISGNGQSEVTSLLINGDSQPDIEPGGTFTERFYGGTNTASGNITMTGQLTFLSATGNSNESPAWNLRLRDPVTPVPEAGSLAMAIAGLGIVGATVRRRRTKV